MRLLVDTQAIIWFQTSDNRLTKTAKQLIDDPNNHCYLSVASLWEMAIKVALNKLHIEVGYEKFYNYLLANKFNIINIEQSHLITLTTLPHHHGDPFDRILIAQAIAEDLTIVSADRHFESYEVPVIWN